MVWMKAIFYNFNFILRVSMSYFIYLKPWAFKVRLAILFVLKLSHVNYFSLLAVVLGIVFLVSAELGRLVSLDRIEVTCPSLNKTLFGAVLQTVSLMIVDLLIPSFHMLLLLFVFSCQCLVLKLLTSVMK